MRHRIKSRKFELTFDLDSFVWASTTVVLNRSILSLQHASALNSLREVMSSVPRTVPPFRYQLDRIDEYEPETDIYQELETWRAVKSRGIALYASPPPSSTWLYRISIVPYGPADSDGHLRLATRLVLGPISVIAWL